MKKSNQDPNVLCIGGHICCSPPPVYQCDMDCPPYPHREWRRGLTAPDGRAGSDMPVLIFTHHKRDCLTNLRWAKNDTVQKGLPCRKAA